MTEKVDLVAYLPSFLKEFKEIAVTLEAENPEFVLVWNAAERILSNEFIETADEYGISRFEKLLNVFPSKEDTLDKRRLRVLAKFSENAPYTLRSLDNVLKNICGKNGYILELASDKYSVKVKIALKVKKQADIVSDVLKRMIPCNMFYSVELLFNTWRLVKKYKWSAVKKTSWRHIKEEVLI